MAENLQVEQALNTTPQSVQDQNGNTSLLVLTDSWIGVGTNPTNLLGHRDFGGVDTILLLQHAFPEGDATQSVLFKLNPREAVFNLDVVGNKNSRARIHFGDPQNPHNPITMLGNVGIGTTTPREKLEVQGNILATGDVQLAGADCAEEFDMDDGQALEPGTVMVIGDEDKLHQCTEAYDKKVAGVLSGAGDCRPGIVLGKEPSPNKRLPLALTGKVYCKVDAQYSPIKVGDLLTTSSTPGHAMKAGDPLKAFGAVIGKALRPLTQGQDLIPILVALQ